MNAMLYDNTLPQISISVQPTIVDRFAPILFKATSALVIPVIH